MENNEENKIKEAQITEPEKTSEDQEKPKKIKKYSVYIEFLLFLILGILVGITLKTEAVKRITMGFEDYKMKIFKQDYNINKIQKELMQKELEEAEKEYGSEDISNQQN